MNPRRGITTTVAAVRRRRRSGEARAIRRRSGECRHEAASAREGSERRGFVIATPPILKGSEKLSVCQGQAARRAVASQTLTACHFSRGLVAWGCGRNAITSK